MTTAKKKAPLLKPVDHALETISGFHNVVKATEQSLEDLAITAKAKLGKDAHLYFLAPKRGGKLQQEDYDMLVASTAFAMADSQPNLYGDFKEYITADGKAIPAIDSTAEKKTIVQFKGKPLEKSIARSKVRSNAQSRMAKIAEHINPDCTGVVGKKDPEPQQSKNSLDKMLVCIATMEKIIDKADGSINVTACNTLVKQLKVKIMPF
jgi:hypothetical protein